MDIRIALTGFGNVGQGLAVLLRDRGSLFERMYGVRLLLSAVADRRGAAVDQDGLDPSALLDAKERFGTVARHTVGQEGLKGTEFLAASGASVLVEAASTNFTDAEPGWSYTREALGSGMDVVFASKGALVLHFKEVMDLAREHGRKARFSATVGAPLPVFELAERALLGTDIHAIEGIVNGTTGVILTAMADGASYDQGVKQAQEAGIAETDPTLDVDGWDAAAKAVILANSIMGANLLLDDVQRTGIGGISRSELDEAQLHGETIKLVARVALGPAGAVATVAPERRSRQDVLGRLRGSGMGIVFVTEHLGRVAATVDAEGVSGGISTAMTVLRDLFILAQERRSATQA